MFLASLPPHTCHDAGKRSQAGPLRRLLNQTAQTRSQITIALFELSHISTSFGTRRAAPQSMSGRKMLLSMRQEYELIKVIILQLRGFLSVPICLSDEQ